jgi:hypothetical protein
MACLLLAASADPGDKFYLPRRDFQIPIGISDPAKRPYIKEILLYQSPDGQAWQFYDRTTPDKGSFVFRAPGDGTYFFKMSVVNPTTGKQEDDRPRCVIVDTAKPLLRLISAERQGEDVLVRWDLVEQNPDYATLKLDYRASDDLAAPWVPVQVTAPASGQASFRAPGPMARVRMSVMDLAKNESDVVELPVRNSSGATVSAAGTSGLPPLAGDGAAAPGPLPGPVADRGWSPAPAGVVPAAASTTVPPAPRTPRGPLPTVQMVRKRRITIDYEVTKYGPSGIKSVELYVTRDDGRNWQRCDGEDNVNAALPTDSRSMGPALKRSLTVDLQADGVYGFYLVVKSGAGLGKPPPQNGVDVPQMRIEVDTTAPVAVLHQPQPHPGRRDSLILTWRASDNKLGPTPITLQWAERPDGDWQPIGASELPNAGELVGQLPDITGSFVWQVPTTIPAHVYLRMLVRDQAGNECVAQTAEPVLVDLNEPEVKPLQISVNSR